MYYEFEYVVIAGVWGPKEAAPYNKGGMTLRWKGPQIGAGELTIFITPEGELVCDNQTRPRGFVRAVLDELGLRVRLREGEREEPRRNDAWTFQHGTRDVGHKF